jgi:hypothetical protein
MPEAGQGCGTRSYFGANVGGMSGPLSRTIIQGENFEQYRAQFRRLGNDGIRLSKDI